MGKKKLQRFAQLSSYEHVFELTYSTLMNEGSPFHGTWKKGYFKNTNPLVIELGCGKGEYSVGLAKDNPHKNFIGIDRKGARLWSGATKAQKDEQGNVAFIRTDINLLDKIFAKKEVDEIWLTFPDPQMKKTRARLLSSHFLNRYAKIISDKGIIHLKTDSNFLYNYTKSLLKANHIEPLVDCDDLHNKPDDYGALTSIQTFYEQQWLERGKTIKYLEFPLSPNQVLIEPETEPEHDDYTSWCRFSPKSE